VKKTDRTRRAEREMNVARHLFSEHAGLMRAAAGGGGGRHSRTESVANMESQALLFLYLTSLFYHEKVNLAQEL